MEHAEEKAAPAQELTPTQERVDAILTAVLLPTLLAAAIAVGANYHPQEYLLLLLGHGLLVVTGTLRLYRNASSDWVGAAVAIGIAGACASIIQVIALLVTDFHVVHFFRLFTHPLITGMLDAVAAGLVYTLWQLLLHKTSKKKNK